MSKNHLHNSLFAFSVIAILAATTWSVGAREPTLAGNPSLPHKSRQTTAQKPPSLLENETMTAPQQEKSVTEIMIEKGDLSKQPAKFYRKVEP
jgi:hypothetical protein